jgi:hypothetical protein
MLIHEDRLFPPESESRKIRKALYTQVQTLPIISPHGHTQATWFANNEPFPDPAKLFVQPDHYVYRMLLSQGIPIEDLDIGEPELQDARKVWRIFASHYYLFRGTPNRLWLDFAFQELFELEERLSAKTADLYFDTISEKLRTPEFLSRALYERFNLEVLATTDSPLDSLDDHKAICESGWKARILPNFRPDPIVDPEFRGFAENIALLGERSGEDTSTSAGYLNALRKSRARFHELGCTVLVQLSVSDAAGAPVSHNFYWWAKDEASLGELNGLPQAKLTASETVAAGNGERTATVKIGNSGTTPALTIKFTLKDAATGARILAANHSENYVSLLPGEERTITVEFPAGSAKPAMGLRGWNLTTETVGVE